MIRPSVAVMALVSSAILRRELTHVSAWRTCPVEEGGGVCPDGNTCCPTNIKGISSCITVPEGPHNGTSVCCVDDGVGVTGCGLEYQCASTIDNGTQQFYCELRDSAKNETPVPPFWLPRYRLGQLRASALKQVHSLPVVTADPDAPQLAYYSSMMALDAMDAASVARRQTVCTVLIVVHGSGRNADDYLSCAVASVPNHQRDSTLVLAPRFLAPGDGPVNATNSSVKVLRWEEFFPVPHTWRYGADAIKTNISSFQAMDVLVEQINRTNFPRLQQIIVAGHSAGGQFTHRWALTSGSSAWGDKHPLPSSRIRLRVIAANPRSFCYLDARRYVNGTLQLPSAAAIEACPGYDSWEWGFAPGNSLACPYKDQALAEVGGLERMAVRYSLRDVVYIAGELDVLEVRSSCEDDDFQGPNRRQRSKFFFESLNEIYPLNVHRRSIAPNTPHDHCLVFQSDPFQEEVFGSSTKTGVTRFGDDLL